MKAIILAALLIFAVPPAFAQSASTAVSADPAPDAAHPARMAC